MLVIVFTLLDALKLISGWPGIGSVLSSGAVGARFVEMLFIFKCSTCWEPRLVSSTEMNWGSGV